MRLNPRRSVPAAVLAAALAAGAAACGSGSGSTAGGSATTPTPTASKDPLAGLGSGAIISKAMKGTQTAPSVVMRMATTDSGRKLALDFTIIRGKGCQGTMAEAGQGTAKVVYDGKTGWLNGDKKFWVSNGGNDPAVLSILAGKYVKTTDKTFTGSFTQFCDLKQLLSGFSGGADGMPESHATVNGQPAIELKDTGDKAAVYVSDTASPVLLEVYDPTTGGSTMYFGEYGAATALTIPPASEVVDGSKYGF